jgi:hypothetical protein
MKILIGVLTIIFLSNAANASPGDRPGGDAVQSPQASVSSYSTHHWRFTKYYASRPDAATVRPILPSPVIDSERAFFQGTGDGSVGGWRLP